MQASVLSGSTADVADDIAAARPIAKELRQPLMLFEVEVGEAMLALALGRFAEGEDSVARAFALGERALPEMAIPVYRLQRYTLSELRGDVDEAEIEPAIRDLVSTYPARPSSAALSRICTCGSIGLRRRSACWQISPKTTSLPCRSTKSGSLSQFPGGDSRIPGELESSAVLYRLLLPWAALNTGDAYEGMRGSVSRYLGLLAAAMGRWDDAVRHYEVALDANERWGLRPWLAHTQHDYARTLLARGHDQDRDKAATLLESALTTSRQLGMKPLADKVSALLSALEPTKSAQVPTFAHYRIESEIGRGGMGVVYRATDLQLERSVALKLIAPELASQEDFRRGSSASRVSPLRSITAT